MESRMQLHPVTVTRMVGPSKGSPDILKVKPENLDIHPGDELEFTFEGCRNPTIMIPVEGVMTKRIAVAEKDAPSVIRLQVMSEPKVGKINFPYAIYSTDIWDFAEGNSPPRMILDGDKDP